ncbi:MAG: SDR family oxidoreductase [Candidatus Omnitrophica bacterium]|nr:SDR family oxidoreductase [Candidatus Omnitrophota bacterium]MDD5429550.1 SDR family oxidoreductase [Candidatus Omnitrophota bacterium]
MNKSLEGKKVLVTGGAGFIGSHIVDKLVFLGAKVIVIDDLFTGKLENLSRNMDKLTFIEGDFSDEAILEKALKGADFILHQAALRSVPKSVEEPFKYHQVNVTGTLKLFLKAKENKIKRIVFASSSSVYGERSDFPEKETDMPKPISPYASTKLMGENYAYLFSKLYNLEIVSLRYFNVFGPRQSLENQYAVVIPKFITCLLAGKQPPIYGDGQQERDFTYVEDVAEANILALGTENIGGEIFNVASGRPESVNSLLKSLAKIIPTGVSPVYLEKRQGDVLKTHADISKARKVLSWSPRLDFNESLVKTVKWFKAHHI